MQDYIQEDPYSSGHHRFSPHHQHHDPYYNDGGGGGDPDYSNYDGRTDQYIHDDRMMKDIPNGGPYNNNSSSHNLHYDNGQQQQYLPARSLTPSDYAAPTGRGSYDGVGVRGRGSYTDHGGAESPYMYQDRDGRPQEPHNSMYGNDDYVDVGYPQQRDSLGRYPDEVGYPPEDIGGYPGNGDIRYGNQGDRYEDGPPQFPQDDRGNHHDYSEYPPLSPSHHPPQYHTNYPDGLLHDDDGGYGQRGSYAGSRTSFQEQPSHNDQYQDQPPHNSSYNENSYPQDEYNQQPQPAPRYNGGVHYPDDNYMDPHAADHPSFHQDHSSFQQDHPSFQQDHPSFQQDHPSFQQEHPSFQQDHPSFQQDHPSFQQDHPSFQQDQPNYNQDHPSFQNEHPSFREGSHHGSRQHLPQDLMDRPEDHPSFHDPRHDSYQGPYDPHQGQYSPAHSGQYNPNNQLDRYSDAPPRDRLSLDQPPSGSYHGDPRPSSRLQDSFQQHDNYMDSPPQHQGLPPVHADPFADDPFQREKLQHLQHEDPYFRGRSSPGGGPEPVPSTPLYDERDAIDPYSQRQYQDDYGQGRGPPYVQDDPYLDREEELTRRMDQMTMSPPRPHSRGPPSIDGHRQRLPNPDLQEVIDFLMSPDDTVKASAAAHLQHITFMDDAVKAKTRSMGGIRPLIRLLSHELVEVHKNACGALRNLSYGKNNMDNKREIRNENGIPELIRLLRKTDQEDVKESVTGVLWNLSSAEDLKQAILEDGLTVLINSVILRYSGWSALGNQSSQLPWTTVCRNTTGILRNISSAGFDARKRMRECKGLVNALIYVLKLAAEDVESNAIDNKVVENTVCVLRNLSFRIQEVVDPDFYKKRSLPRQQGGTPQGGSKGESKAGCFGNKSVKAKAAQSKNAGNQPTGMPPQLPPASVEYRSLWGSEIHSLYSTVLKRCTNTITLEASAGAIQNLTACDWQPAVDSRAMVRKEKGLPLLVDLLSSESDRVVCATATALRNLAIDEKNKELVGKYAIRQLVSKLPRDSRSNMPDDTICAVVATLYEVVKDNQDFALAVVQEDGLPRLMHINRSEERYLGRTLKFTMSLLKTLWGFKSLQQEYVKLRYTQADFTTSKATPRKDGSRPPDSTSRTPTSSNHTTPYNTLSRPMSGQGYDDNTLTPARGGGMMRPGGHMIQNHPQYQPQGQRYPHSGGSDIDTYGTINRSHTSLHDNSRDRMNYSRDRIPQEDIPLSDLGSGYAPLDEPRPHRTKPPVGGVPLFPSLSPAEHSPHSYRDDHMAGGPEPLYAQVNKSSRRRIDPYLDAGPGPVRTGSPHGSLHHSIDGRGGDPGPGGADSWV